MASIVVCPLSRLGDVFRSSGARDVVTLMRRGQFEVPRLPWRRHLRLELSDIVEPADDHVMPAADHLDRLLSFAEDWNRRRPLLLHCYAAAAFLLTCALRPEAAEDDLARQLRASSPTATPNRRIVALGDAMLRRSGRMIEAIAAIGRGAECSEGVPFSLELDPQMPAYQS